MENPEESLDQARVLEREDRLDAALEIYAALAEAPGDHHAHPGFWVRLADLQRRLGEGPAAARSLSRSLDLFLDAGQRNNALAVAHRITRTDPSRTDALLRVAELASEQGYPGDARAAVVRFAERAPAEEVEQALLELWTGVRGSPGAAVDALREAMGEVAPDLHLPGAPPAAALPAPERVADPLPVEDDFAPEPLPGLSPAPGLQPTSLEEAGPDVVAPLEGLETTHADYAWEPAEPAAGMGLEPGSAAPAAEDREEIGAEPAGMEEDGEEDTLPLLGTLPEWEEPQAADPLDPPVGGEPPVEGGLPLLGTFPLEAELESVPAPDEAEAARAELLRDPSDLAEHRRLVQALREEGDAAALESALEDAADWMARAGEPAEAARLLAELAERRPLGPELAGRWVAAAERAGDRAVLVRATLALAAALDASDPDRSRAALRRVLELDPGNRQAGEALARLTPPPPPADHYVDLGALIFDPSEDDTRFQVDAEQPSGDEDRDFAEILQLFRQQVSERIDPEDAASHYDLGLAFKEMGLLDDAVAQLQIALRGGANPLATLEVLGECFLEKGEHSLAMRVLGRAADLRGASDLDLVGVHYLLGRCGELLDRPADAVAAYERVVAVDIGFRDATRRLEALRSGGGDAR